MIEQDTVKLLRECDAGIKMGVSSIDEVLPYVRSDALKKYLADCKQEFLDEILNNPDLSDDDKESFKHNVQVYGSVVDDYFEIDYTMDECPVEIYIQITHSHIQD